MSAKVAREMFDLFMPGKYLNGKMSCHKCGGQISKKDAYYRCAQCDLNYCMVCMAQTMSPTYKRPSSLSDGSLHVAKEHASARKPLLEVLPGDVFLCGPDYWGIHHTVLSCERLVPAEKRVRDALTQGNDKVEILKCGTVETSQTALSGGDTKWYQTCSYYSRNLETGATQLIGDMIPGSNNLEIYSEAVPVKVLLHPLRPHCGGPELDEKTFDKVVHKASAQSKSYGRITALEAFVAGTPKLRRADFPNVASRHRLFEDLIKRWERPPICTSVVIMVWQMYFAALFSGAGNWAADLVVQHILEWIPLWCDKTTPSMLVKSLTESGWMLKNNFDAN